jgi:pSer/pThr/pTyr-binding forkhead associated (FHA) protein
LSVSSNHAKIIVNNVCAYIVDLAATNGTKLNGRKLANGETVEIFSNDKIRFGKGNFPYSAMAVLTD